MSARIVTTVLSAVSGLMLALATTTAFAEEAAKADKDCYKETQTVQVEQTIVRDKEGNPVSAEKKEVKITKVEKVDCPTT